MQALRGGGGYLKADERNRLQSVFNKAKRHGYLPHSFNTLDKIRKDSDAKLYFSSRYNPNHVFYRFLHEPKTPVTTFVDVRTI